MGASRARQAAAGRSNGLGGPGWGRIAGHRLPTPVLASLKALSGKFALHNVGRTAEHGEEGGVPLLRKLLSFVRIQESLKEKGETLEPSDEALKNTR